MFCFPNYHPVTKSKLLMPGAFSTCLTIRCPVPSECELHRCNIGSVLCRRCSRMVWSVSQELQGPGDRLRSVKSEEFARCLDTRGCVESPFTRCCQNRCTAKIRGLTKDATKACEFVKRHLSTGWRGRVALDDGRSGYQTPGKFNSTAAVGATVKPKE